MKNLQWFLAGTMAVALSACGSNSGGSGSGEPASDGGDSQIAPEDALDVGSDAVATDIAGPDSQDADAATEVYMTDWATYECPPPGSDDVAEDVQLDAGDSGDTFGPPANCMGGIGGGGNCSNGLTCWSAPCPKCGVMPQGWCVPPLKGAACYDYTQCIGGDCYHAAPMNGVAGWCLPVNKVAGQCWPNVSELIPDCYTAATCEGASVCPPGAECLVADKPGTCKPAGEQKGSVILWERNGGVVSPGENVVVTWINYTGASIFLPGCGTYSIQTSPDSKTWTDKGPNIECVWEGIAVEVPAGGYFDTQAWTAPNGSGTVGNYRFHGTYSTGCAAGKPISQAGCTATSATDSSAFFVGYVP